MENIQPPKIRPASALYWQEPRRKIFWILVSTFLCATYVISIAFAAAFNFSLSSLPPWLRGGAVVGALLLALLPILFWWRQTWHFETWIQQNPLNLTEAALEFEKTRFKTNSEFARALWSAIVVIFTALLITTALKSEPHTKPKSCSQQSEPVNQVGQ